MTQYNRPFIARPNQVSQAENLNAKAEDFQSRFDLLLDGFSVECHCPSLVVNAESARLGFTPYSMQLNSGNERHIDVRENIPAAVAAELRRRAANLLEAADAVEEAERAES